MKKLIISADDFGLHSSINEAIEKGFQDGLLTSASIIANGPSFSEAVNIAKRNPNLGIGLHFNIIEGKSIASENNVASLLDEGGMFFENYNKLSKRIMFGQVRLEEIEKELEAQIKHCTNSGLTLTHIDSHQHLHMLPKIYKILVKVSNKYGINKFRYLNPPFVDFSFSQQFKTFLSIFFKIFKSKFAYNVITPDYFIGFFNSGNLKCGYIIDVLSKINSGVIEIGFHPGLDNVQLTKSFPNWNKYYDYTFDWESEYSTITNPKFRQYIEENNIKLLNFKNL